LFESGVEGFAPDATTPSTVCQNKQTQILISEIAQYMTALHLPGERDS
jgi:hypothetical protein